MEKISVIIPVYNVEQYLRRCLESIICQTYRNLEIILINDGSTDESLSICEEFVNQDSRIRLINQENRGLAAVRNRGIQEATGELLSFIDSDDYVDENFIENLYECLIKNGADICVSNVQYENTKTTYYLIKDTYSDKRVLNRFEIMKEYLNPTGGIGNYIVNKLYKRQLFYGIKFPENELFEDAATMFKILNNVNRAVIEKDTNYHYCLRDGSITEKYSPENNNVDLLKVNKSKAYFICENFPQLSSQVFYQYLTAFLWYTNKSALMKINNDIILKEYLKDLEKLKKQYSVRVKMKYECIFFIMRINLKFYIKLYRLVKSKK